MLDDEATVRHEQSGPQSAGGARWPSSYGHVVNLYSVCLRIHTLAKDRPTMHLGGSVVSSPGPVVWCASQCTSRKAEKAAGQARNSLRSQLTLPFFGPFVVVEASTFEIVSRLNLSRLGTCRVLGEEVFCRSSKLAVMDFDQSSILQKK